METTEKMMTAEESLQLIGQTIANYKRNYKEESFYFLLWGWITVLASISQFAIIKVLLIYKYFHLINTLSFINWGLYLFVGIFLQYRHRHNSVSAVSSHLAKFISILWRVNGLAILFSLFISYKLKTFPVPLILLIIGISTLTNGMIIKFRPLIYGGISLFIFCALSSFFPDENQLLIYSCAIVLGYIIPGYLLKSTKE
jgi:hypothetical protein